MLTSGTVTCAQLRDRAREYHGVQSAVEFVKAEISHPKGRPTASSEKGYGAVNGEITYWDIAFAARDWDECGLTTVDEFLDSFECEVAGSGRSDIVAETLRLLGVLASEDAALEKTLAAV